MGTDVLRYEGNRGLPLIRNQLIAHLDGGWEMRTRETDCFDLENTTRSGVLDGPSGETKSSRDNFSARNASNRGREGDFETDPAAVARVRLR